MPLISYMSRVQFDFGALKLLQDELTLPALIPELAEEASHEHLSATNPRPASARDIRDIPEAAFR